jgi:hypothetical protein
MLYTRTHCAPKAPLQQRCCWLLLHRQEEATGTPQVQLAFVYCCTGSVLLLHALLLLLALDLLLLQQQLHLVLVVLP